MDGPGHGSSSSSGPSPYSAGSSSSVLGDASMILTHGFTSTWKANIISVHHHLASTVGASEHLNSFHPFTLTPSP